MLALFEMSLEIISHSSHSVRLRFAMRFGDLGMRIYLESGFVLFSSLKEIELMATER
jgi:hypothetical protein